MPKDDESPEKTVTCPICGYESPLGSKRCDHCYNSLVDEPDAAEGTEAPAPQDPELGELRKIPGVGSAKAEILKEAGYHSVEDIKTASVEELSSVKGIGEKLAAKIIQGANDVSNPSNAPLASWLEGEDDGLNTWLSGEDAPQPQSEAVNKEVSPNDSLARWLAGDEEDVNVWLSETQEMERTGVRKIGPHETLAREAELIQLRETLREKLREFESGEFDPQKTVEELAKAKGELESEKSLVKQLMDELENVKRGSIAVIKFIKSQQGNEADQSTLADKLASEMANRETLELRIMQLEEVVSSLKAKLDEGISGQPIDAQELARREIAMREKEAQLDAMKRQLLSKEEALSAGMFTAGVPAIPDAPRMQVQDFSAKEQDYILQIQDYQAKLAQAEVEIKQKEEMLRLSSGAQSKGAVDKEILAKLEEAQKAERTLVVREQEVQRLRDELKIRDEDLKKLKEPMKYKEEEMLRREEDLMFRERLLQEEQKKVAQTRSELGSMDELALKQRLEELKAEVNAKEEEIRSKEKFISMKEEELRMREQGVISEEIEKREQDRMLELKQEKVKTGTARLDDLLMGGMPFGSNVLVYGPPFMGKEVLLNTFIAEGLKKGVPAVWVITEKSPKEIREEMTFVVSGYEEYEKLGLVRYVDAYSRSMGDDSQDPYTDYIESPTDYESIQKAIEEVTKQFLEKHEYYRVGFRSISTLIAYLDPATAFRFLSPVVGRRKRDRAVAMYTIEKGVHGEQEIQMIGSLMDGMIEFKVENLNTFLAIRGICDVQSRAFIRYTATKVGVTIGSFSLDHIR